MQNLKKKTKNRVLEIKNRNKKKKIEIETNKIKQK